MTHPAITNVVAKVGTAHTSAVRLTVEVDCEEDGRWIAEVPELPGVMCYGRDRAEALRLVQALALRVVADRFEQGEISDADMRDAGVSFSFAA